jgi:hypothetical protein
MFILRLAVASLQMYSEDMKDFMVKVVSRSGLSQKGAAAPPSLDGA